MKILKPQGFVSGVLSLKDRWLKDRIGQYKLGRNISASRNSWTCEATRIGGSETLFLKVAHYQANDSLDKEANLLGRNISPGFPRLIEAGHSGIYRYLAMELIRGNSLAKIMKSNQTMTFEACLDIITQSCSIFADLHGAGYLARDFQQAHIILEPSGRVRAVDLGMAVEKGYRYKKGELLPFLNCAPEQTKHFVLNERTDIYALGAVLSNFLLKMISPSKVTSVSMLRASDRGQRLEALLSSMMADRPEDRPENLVDVLAELKKIT